MPKRVQWPVQSCAEVRRNGGARNSRNGVGAVGFRRIRVAHSEGDFAALGDVRQRHGGFGHVVFAGRVLAACVASSAFQQQKREGQICALTMRGCGLARTASVGRGQSARAKSGNPFAIGAVRCCPRRHHAPEPSTLRNATRGHHPHSALESKSASSKSVAVAARLQRSRRVPNASLLRIC